MVQVIVSYLKQKNGVDKILPKPSYHSKYYNDTKLDFKNAKEQVMKAEFRRETYKKADGPLQEWAMDLKFKKYLKDVGPGNSIFEYDIRQQRNEYNEINFGRFRTYRSKEEEGGGRNGNKDGHYSSNSSVSGLSERSIGSEFYETRPVSPFPTAPSSSALTLTQRVQTADGGMRTRPATSQSIIGRNSHRHTHHKKEWMVKDPYDPYGAADSAEEMKRTRDLREMARMERRKEFEDTIKPKANALSALLR